MPIKINKTNAFMTVLSGFKWQARLRPRLSLHRSILVRTGLLRLSSLSNQFFLLLIGFIDFKLVKCDNRDFVLFWDLLNPHMFLDKPRINYILSLVTKAKDSCMLGQLVHIKFFIKYITYVWMPTKNPYGSWKLFLILSN